MREKLENFSDLAGKALAEPDRGLPTTAHRHTERFKQLKAEQPAVRPEDGRKRQPDAA